MGEETKFLPSLAEQDIFLDSSAVEHSAVNRRVVGSNPTRGVKDEVLLRQPKTLPKKN